jgi:hypothetical protein
MFEVELESGQKILAHISGKVKNELYKDIYQEIKLLWKYLHTIYLVEEELPGEQSR